MFAKYYQDELAWLREMGKELADTRPELARYLGEPGSDPDVERLLEGFAFLTGRIRQKLDDEFPEFTHGLLDMFCPHYLRPIPAMAIAQITPKQNRNAGGASIPRGTPIESTPVDGTRCRFRTVADLHPAPFALQEVAFRIGHPSKLELRLRTRSGPGLGDRPLRLHLAGDQQVSRALFVLLTHYTDRVTLHGDGRTEATTLAATIRPGGLAEEEAALPLPRGSFRGFRLLQEYFACPERFMFVDVFGLGDIDTGAGGGDLTLSFEFRQLPDDMPPVGDGNVLLDCVPLVNLFDHDADPVRAEAGRTEYRIRPAGKDSEHYEIHSVSAVEGRVRGGGKAERYQPFFTFEPRHDDSGRHYELRRRDSVRSAGTDLYLRLGASDPDQWSELDTISVDLVCSNRDLTTRLGPGDINHATPDTPGAFDYRSVGAPSTPVPPPMGDDVHWRLLAHMTLNLRRLGDRDSLTTALSLYDFRARVDRQSKRRLENLLQAIESVELRREVDLLDGVPVNGSVIALRIDEEKAGGEGETCVLGTILSEFFAQYVSLNSFSRLRIECTGNNEVFTWPARIGRRITI